MRHSLSLQLQYRFSIGIAAVSQAFLPSAVSAHSPAGSGCEHTRWSGCEHTTPKHTHTRARARTCTHVHHGSTSGRLRVADAHLRQVSLLLVTSTLTWTEICTRPHTTQTTKACEESMFSNQRAAEVLAEISSHNQQPASRRRGPRKAPQLPELGGPALSWSGTQIWAVS